MNSKECIDTVNQIEKDCRESLSNDTKSSKTLPLITNEQLKSLTPIEWYEYQKGNLPIRFLSKSKIMNHCKSDNDPVNSPEHYTSHPSGIECITITRHMNFNLGNAIKYLWRSEKKQNQIQDLEKAIWYIKDEIQRIKDQPQQEYKT